MKIAFYAPFKPLGHPHPSGDLVIAQGLADFLKQKGHDIRVQSRFRARWIYLKPWRWPKLWVEFLRILIRLLKDPPDLWLTYHTYYKAPDPIGPWVCRLLGIHYIIFQGIYSTKRKRRLKTVLGFYLNRAALLQAGHLFTNKRPDLKNLKRLVNQEKITYIKPGIHLDQFTKKDNGVEFFKDQLIDPETPVILTAAMFRDDVKTKGLVWLIQTLGELKDQPFQLMIAGSGKMEGLIKKQAETYLTGKVIFTGKLERAQMPFFYSSGDIFAFPGIGESLGMVFLEAQACGLPVVAFDNAGVPEAVAQERTGFLVQPYDRREFLNRIEILLSDKEKRVTMGKNAVSYVRTCHDLERNYSRFEKQLRQMVV